MNADEGVFPVFINLQDDLHVLVFEVLRKQDDDQHRQNDDERRQRLEAGQKGKGLLPMGHDGGQDEDKDRPGQAEEDPEVIIHQLRPIKMDIKIGDGEIDLKQKVIEEGDFPDHILGQEASEKD